ncbi:hypothetical protein PAL_GLEAN10014306 [Pteropus alecto]|uniref:Uncharacterized protein n=1 Tax=Pteropus alecto TaxID=9402 RepID=L5L1G7_PTEAL|nr:hypothetical protein PAL_GLEAN10014306 [Pteropus alecto]
MYWVSRRARPRVRREGRGLGEHIPERQAGCFPGQPSQKIQKALPSRGHQSLALARTWRGTRHGKRMAPFLGLGPTEWSFLNVSSSSQDKLTPNRLKGQETLGVRVSLCGCLSVVCLSASPEL